MPRFEDRLAQINTELSEADAFPPSPANGPTLRPRTLRSRVVPPPPPVPLPSAQVVPGMPDLPGQKAGPANDASPPQTRRGSSIAARVLRALVTMPVAVALGALAVIIGGLVQIHIIDGGPNPTMAYPPGLGMVAIAVALILSLVADKIVGFRGLGIGAVTAGFLGMMWGEGLIAERYPMIWAELYEAKYLSPALELAGL